MKETQENKKKYGKNCAVIKYNNKVAEDKDTKVIVRTLIDDVTYKNVHIFILNYKLNGIPYEVVLGKLQLNQRTGELGEKSKLIQKYITKQLNTNSKGRNNFDYCNHLESICEKKNIPFMYTEEGVKIVTNNKENDDIAMERTYSCDENNNTLELKCLKPEKRMELYISRANIRKNIDEKVRQNKAVEAAENELKPELLKNFNNGRKLKQYKDIQSEDVKYSSRKDIIDWLIKERLQKKDKNEIKDKDETKDKPTLKFPDYMKIKQYYKEKENRDVEIDHSMVIGEPPKETLEEKIFKLKEKAIAIDIKRLLEDEESVCLEGIMNNDENPEKHMENLARYDSIQRYEKVFDFIKTGRDVNAQFNYSMYFMQNGFSDLELIVENQLKKQDEIKKNEADEIIKYIQLKEELLKNVKLNKGKGFFDLYNENEKVKEFVEFIMKSESRKYTKAEEKELMAEAYQEWIDDSILENKDDVELYNTYASRFNAENCIIPENRNIEENIDEIEEDRAQ